MTCHLLGVPVYCSFCMHGWRRGWVLICWETLGLRCKIFSPSQAPSGYAISGCSMYGQVMAKPYFRPYQRSSYGKAPAVGVYIICGSSRVKLGMLSNRSNEREIQSLQNPPILKLHKGEGVMVFKWTRSLPFNASGMVGPLD